MTSFVEHNFSECILNSNSDCGLYGNHRHAKLSSFAELNYEIKTHCNNLKFEVPQISESELIQNRIGAEYNASDKICPRHRYFEK
jgi:hypothetical protein